MQIVKSEIVHFESFYNLKCEEKIIYYSGFSHEPNKEDFLEYYKKHFENKLVNIYFLVKLEDFSSVIGYLKIDYSIDYSSAEISYAISEKYCGNGFSTFLINNSLTYINKSCKLVTAWVADNNIASCRALLSNGFLKTNETSFRLLGGSKVVSFFKYQKRIIINE